jgi:hypothetical protein
MGYELELGYGYGSKNLEGGEAKRVEAVGGGGYGGRCI